MERVIVPPISLPDVETCSSRDTGQKLRANLRQTHMRAIDYSEMYPTAEDQLIHFDAVGEWSTGFAAKLRSGLAMRAEQNAHHKIARTAADSSGGDR